jgi:hypothetical protein
VKQLAPNWFHDYAVWFGFFNAAVVHLLLHGFYKAYVSICRRNIAKTNTIKIKPVQAVIVLFFGILGAFAAFDRERN